MIGFGSDSQLPPPNIQKDERLENRQFYYIA